MRAVKTLGVPPGASPETMSLLAPRRPSRNAARIGGIRLSGALAAACNLDGEMPFRKGFVVEVTVRG
jgi:hypothetical protein